ncbi:regulatory protein YycH of two-component signal transduction system YycFG [Salirhabdus euzebyi]|uniref:Regulatory protein YycH of two-component signal transduction system YycFG n=1 Tax=Salirhabdus euzebyi TaxID=394506 RepID=A0A841Q7P9_9BACI|nr:two-component system activity regulator YycH [Salirhabdus euzebyi]MBB6454450.1 regulatory protein YycH of two-component signal transduction system YycFG [Salirhabdus euzebyi]
MNLETIKTAVLVILVSISLILTIGVWNFSSQYDELENSTVLRETSINGEKQSAKDIIKPTNIVFHNNGAHYGLKEKETESSLYKEMQQWSIRQFGNLQQQSIEIDEPSVEVIFPVELPYEVLPLLFDIDENIVFPDSSFNRIQFQLRSETQGLDVLFLSTVHDQTLGADIQETNAYQKLSAFIEGGSLNSLISFSLSNGNTVYLPEEEVTLQNRTFTTNTISDWPLINNLFRDPTAVKNIGYYTDGSRKLETSILANQKYMEFVNPISTENKQFEREELLSKSISFVNNHDGWTDEFMLLDIDTINAVVHYQWVVKGYPVMGKLGTMEQIWQNQELTNYNRPLVELSHSFPDYEKPKLMSGSTLITFIEQNSLKYPLNSIEDIRIGYKIVQEETPDIISLQPNWYMKVSGKWILIENPSEQGGV